MSANRPVVGLVEADFLRAPLAEAGVTIVTGSDFRSAAAAVRQHLTDNGEIPVIVSDAALPGMKPWVTRLAAEHLVAVVAVDGGSGFVPEGAHGFRLPIDIGDVLSALGVEAENAVAAVGAPVVDRSDLSEEVDPSADWNDTGATLSSPHPDQSVDDVAWDDAPTTSQHRPADNEGMTVSAPAPVVPPAPIAPAPVQVEDDPWGDNTPAAVQQTAPPATYPAPHPSTVAPAPIQRPAESPAPVHRPEPVQPPAPTHVNDEPAPAPVRPAPPMREPEPRVAPFENVTEPVRPNVTSISHEAPRPVREPAPAVTPAPTVAWHSQSGRGAQVVVVFSGKGGVGKTSTSINLAQMAAQMGLRVVLIDANRGQGDIRSYLRLGDSPIPTIYDVGVSGDIREAMLDPGQLSELRGSRRDHLEFVLVAAANRDLLATGVVTPELYLSAVSQAREMAELVIVDTQILEDDSDDFGMVERFVKPILHAPGTWGVGISDLSVPGMKNLHTRLKEMRADGVSRDRLLTFLNRVPNEVPYSEQTTADMYNAISTYIGQVAVDPEIPRKTNAGLTVTSSRGFSRVLSTVLNIVTGDSRFIAADTRQNRSEGRSSFRNRWRKG